MSDTANAVTQREIELKRSAVRRHVTYFAVITYTVVSAGTVGWLLAMKKYDMAVAVLGGI